MGMRVLKNFQIGRVCSIQSLEEESLHNFQRPQWQYEFLYPYLDSKNRVLSLFYCQGNQGYAFMEVMLTPRFLQFPNRSCETDYCRPSEGWDPVFSFSDAYALPFFFK